MILTTPNTFTSGDVAEPTEVNDNFTAVAAVVNGNLTNDNVKADAAIAASKLAAPFEHISLPLKFGDIMTANPNWSGVAVGVHVARVLVPYIGTAGGGNWKVESYSWACNDTGDGNGKFDLFFGYYDKTTGVWATVATLANAITLANGAGGAGSPNSGHALTGTILVDQPTNPPYIVLAVDTQGVGVLTGGAGAAPYDTLEVNINLIRYSTSG